MATVDINSTRTFRDLDLNFTIHPIRKDINTHKNEYAIINSVKDKIIFNLLLFNPLITSKFTDWTNFKISFLIISNKILTKIYPTFDANLIKNDLSFFAKSINELTFKSKF